MSRRSPVFVGGNGTLLEREQKGNIRELTLEPWEVVVFWGQEEKQNLVKRSSEGVGGGQEKKVIGEVDYRVSKYCHICPMYIDGAIYARSCASFCRYNSELDIIPVLKEVRGALLRDLCWYFSVSQGNREGSLWGEPGWEREGEGMGGACWDV